MKSSVNISTLKHINEHNQNHDREKHVMRLEINLRAALSGAVAVASCCKRHWLETVRHAECKVSCCDIKTQTVNVQRLVTHSPTK